MCKLLVGMTSEPGNTEFQTYIKAQRPELLDQKDGIGAVVVTVDNKVYVFRELTEYYKIFAAVDSLLNKAKLVSIHTRIKTSGETDLANVHFFEVDNHLFAHNGFIRDYHSYKNWSWKKDDSQTTFFNKKKSETGFVSGEEDEGVILEQGQECAGCWTAKQGVCRKHKKEGTALVEVDASKMCDSYQFLQNIDKPVTEDILSKEVEERDFTGAALMLNKENLDAFLLVKKEVKAQFGKDWGIFYSYTPDKEVDFVTTESKYGVLLKRTHSVKTDAPIRTVYEGIYKLDY